MYLSLLCQRNRIEQNRSLIYKNQKLTIMHVKAALRVSLAAALYGMLIFFAPGVHAQAGVLLQDAAESKVL